MTARVDRPAIPARIIQTAKRRELPLKQRAMAVNARLLNPDFEWRFFDDADVEAFVDAEFPEYRSTFDNFRFPIQRYDFFRYLAVYRMGGFYFDLDVLLARDLQPLLAHGCVFPFEGLTFSRLLRDAGMDWEIGNFAFGASAGHPFLAAVIDNCVRGQEDPEWVRPMMKGAPLLSTSEYYVLNTTGPGVLSRTLAEHPELSDTLTVLFPDDVCDMKSWNVFGDYGIHLMEGTWRPSMSYIRRRIAQRWEVWAMNGLIRESRQLGKTRAVRSAT